MCATVGGRPRACGMKLAGASGKGRSVPHVSGTRAEPRVSCALPACAAMPRGALGRAAPYWATTAARRQQCIRLTACCALLEREQEETRSTPSVVDREEGDARCNCER